MPSLLHPRCDPDEPSVLSQVPGAYLPPWSLGVSSTDLGARARASADILLAGRATIGCEGRRPALWALSGATAATQPGTTVHNPPPNPRSGKHLTLPSGAAHPEAEGREELTEPWVCRPVWTLSGPAAAVRPSSVLSRPSCPRHRGLFAQQVPEPLPCLGQPGLLPALPGNETQSLPLAWPSPASASYFSPCLSCPQPSPAGGTLSVPTHSASAGLPCPRPTRPAPSGPSSLPFHGLPGTAACSPGTSPPPSLAALAVCPKQLFFLPSSPSPSACSTTALHCTGRHATGVLDTY